MEELAYRLRISALWILGMVSYFAYRTIALSEGVTEVSVLSNTEMATVLGVMMLFAFLSLMLKNPTNRSVNMVAGTVLAVGLLALFIDGITAYPSAIFNLMTGISVVFMAAVVWLANRSPKRAA